jgi:hypothetical protein
MTSTSADFQEDKLFCSKAVGSFLVKAPDVGILFYHTMGKAILASQSPALTSMISAIQISHRTPWKLPFGTLPTLPPCLSKFMT